MTIIDLGKNLSQYGVQINDVSPKQLLVETLEAIREIVEKKPVDAILVGSHVYGSMVDRLEEWCREGELVPYRPDVVFRGIRVYVFKSEEERMSLRWGLWQSGKKVLEVVE